MVKSGPMDVAYSVTMAAICRRGAHRERGLIRGTAKEIFPVFVRACLRVGFCRDGALSKVRARVSGMDLFFN